MGLKVCFFLIPDWRFKELFQSEFIKTCPFYHECAFVKVTEHHPDANHGFEIGTGVVEFNNTRIFTETILIRLPTPDFSMPYNVITFMYSIVSVFW